MIKINETDLLNLNFCISLTPTIWDTIFPYRDPENIKIKVPVWDYENESFEYVWESIFDVIPSPCCSEAIAESLRMMMFAYALYENGHRQYKPFYDLWEKGLIPVFDGKVWRLHEKENNCYVAYTKEECTC